MPLPLDLRLALSPLETYRELIAKPVRGTWPRALERPALLAVIIGAAVTISSGGRVPFGLVLTGIVCWSFVPIVQWMIGAFVVSRVRGRPTSMPRCIELLFVGHLPWSLWVLAITGLAAFTKVPQPLGVQVAALLIPGVWTAFIVSAFCQTALGCTRARARRLTAVHQTITAVVFFSYVFLVSGFLARILARVGV